MAGAVSPNPDPSEIVNVPVPRAHLGVVYAALGAAMAGEVEASTEGKASTGVLIDDGNGIWTEEMMRRLQANLHYPGPKALLGLCAERTPEEVMLDEVAQQAGVEVTQIRAELGAMTKLCKRLFGRKTWPISVRWTPTGYGIYSMKREVAAWWEPGD